MAESNQQLRRLRRHSTTGSEGAQPDFSEPEFLIIGQIVRPHGVRGEVGMKIITKFPEHLAEIETVYLGPQHNPFQIEQIRRHREGMIVKLKSLKTLEDAEILRGMFVQIRLADAVPLKDGENYFYQLRGIRVTTENESELGRLTGLIETGANDVYIITTPDQREILLPAIPDVILKIDVAQRVMVVRLLEGLV